MLQNNFTIRCRGIILDQNKLLVVKHAQKDGYYALPGGHLEFGEDIRICMIREIKEELGIEPILGNLLYIHSYKQGRDKSDNIHSIEFFFEITNSKDYVNCERLLRSHSHELAEIRWVGIDEDINLLPKQIENDFKNLRLLSNIVRFTD